MIEGHGTFWQRLVGQTRWTWLHERYRAILPADLADRVMTIDSQDRLHAKQGRSTARVVFHGEHESISVYLKRHYRLPWMARLAALVHPTGRYTPGSAEFAHLNRARELGLPVPEVVAAGERIGPWGRTESFLMVAELTGSWALNELLPDLVRELTPQAFNRLKRELTREMAEIAATLHQASVFHKDLYLCHYFLNREAVDRPGERLTLIDLHRLGRHRLGRDRWRWKDLGQLLYSTEGVPGIGPRDVLRFWVHYVRLTGLAHPRWQARMIAWKAARYRTHNRSS